MKKRCGTPAILAILSVIVVCSLLGFPKWTWGGSDPQGIHLTWAQNDVYRTMAVSWWTESPTGSEVRYGTTSGSYPHVAGGSWHRISTTRSTWVSYYHDVELTGLEPGTTYYFVCGAPGHWSREYSFRTIRLNQIVRFVMGGDSRIGAPDSDEIEGPVFPEARIVVSKDAAAEEPDFVVFAGDMVRNGFREDQWKAWLDDVAGNLVTGGGRMIPIVAVIGNHDLGYLYRLPSFRDMTDYDYYRGLFHLPNNELWYTLDFPNIRLIVLCAAGGTGFSDEGRSFGERIEDEALAQVDFLREQLANVSQEWVLTTQHISITGGYGLKPGDNGWGMIYHWVPIFEESLTSSDLTQMPLNLAGHSHHYVRTWPIEHLELPPGFVDFGDTPADLWPNGPPIVVTKGDSREGVTYLVHGVWGAPCEWMEKDSFIRIYDWFAAAYSRQGYVLIEETDEGLHAVMKHAGVVWSWYGLPKELDDFTLHFKTKKLPTAEYNVAF